MTGLYDTNRGVSGEECSLGRFPGLLFVPAEWEISLKA